MSPDFRIVVLPIAEQQLQRAAAWWHDHRPAAPTLLVDEFEAALAQIASAPNGGALYGPRPGVRRWLLPTVRYHIYYRVDETKRTIYVRAVWHATRERGPALR